MKRTRKSEVSKAKLEHEEQQADSILSEMTEDFFNYIVDYKLPSDADKRPEDPYYYCTNCGACIERCPKGAITFEGRHDKQSCSEHVMTTISYIKNNYEINIYSCGLCQVGVPCENGIPEKEK